MKTLIVKKESSAKKENQNSKKVAQCCAKVSKVKAGCHD
jgi:hypothetical protein